MQAFDPVFSWSNSQRVLLRTQVGIWWKRRRGRFGEIISHLAPICQRIQRCDYRTAVGAFPDAYVEGNTLRSLLRRFQTTHVRRWLPRCGKFLSGEAFDSGVMQNTWKRSRKAKAVRQHVFRAGHAEFATEETVA